MLVITDAKYVMGTVFRRIDQVRAHKSTSTGWNLRNNLRRYAKRSLITEISEMEYGTLVMRTEIIKKYRDGKRSQTGLPSRKKCSPRLVFGRAGRLGDR